jgi:hypothetical protein
MELLIQLVAFRGFEIKKEACWMIDNATLREKPEQIKHLVNRLVDVLRVGEAERMDRVEGYNSYALCIEEREGMDSCTTKK